MENQKFQHRSIIKFLFLEGQSPSNMHECMTAVYGDGGSSRTMLFEWARPFKNGQLKIEDRPRSDRSISTTNEKNIKAVEKLVVEDRQITIQEIAEILGISSSIVHGILHDHLHMSKVYSTWIPHFFKDMNELKHLNNFWLVMKKKEMIFFLVLSLLTSDGSISINLNENNHLNNGNKLTLHNHQREVRKQRFFWDYNDVILKEPVPAGTTITKTYYANLLINKLHPEIKKATTRFNFNWRNSLS